MNNKLILSFLNDEFCWDWVTERRVHHESFILLLENIADFDENTQFRIFAEIARKQPHTFRHFPEQFRGNEFICKIVIDTYPPAFEFMSEQIRHTPEFYNKVSTKLPHLIKFMPAEVSTNYDFCVQMVTKNGEDIQYFSPELQNNREICKIALQKNANVIQFFTTEMKNDAIVCEIALEKSGSTMKYMGESIKNDERLCLIAIGNDATAYNYISNEMTKNFEICKKMCTSYGVSGLNLLVPEIQDIEELVRIVLPSSNGFREWPELMNILFPALCEGIPFTNNDNYVNPIIYKDTEYDHMSCDPPLEFEGLVNMPEYRSEMDKKYNNRPEGININHSFYYQLGIEKNGMQQDPPRMQWHNSTPTSATTVNNIPNF
jgi:hypothetical protein